MAWWDDLWLNESFATWISPKMVDSWQPDWRTSLDQLESSFASASADSLVNARRIRQPIETETDIDNAFDDITYGKGAAVLGMFESWVGNETFRNAIRAYLKGHAYTSATTSDFLESLNHGAKQDVGSAFSTFLDQPGIPLVTVKSVGSSNGRRSAVLSQRRFLPVGSSGASTNIWKIPLQLRYQSDGDEAESRFMLDRPQQTASLNTEPTGLQWLLLDRDGVGYYISAYSGDWLRSLLEAGAAKLSAAERMTIAHSISAAVRSADLPLGEALSLQGKLLLDPERRVVQMAAGFLDVREKVPPDLVPNYHRFIQKSLEPLMRGISWQSLRPETDDERLQRLALLVLAAHAGEDSRLIEEAKRLAAAWIENRQAVPPDEAATVLWIAGRHADSGLFDKLMAEAKKTQESSDRQRLITALGAVQDPALAQRALDALVARSFQSVDSETLLAVLSGHVETRSLTYEYLKQHFDAVVAALPADSMFWYLPNAAEGFDTSERQKDVQSFFKNKDVKVTGGPRIIAQVLERIHLNQAFKEAQLPSLIEFLQKQ
jgi:alanyl aminopeptidase